MKSRPILFTGPMVKAILSGRKTQTRRIVNPQPPSSAPAVIQCHDLGFDRFGFFAEDGTDFVNRYGAIGDQLRVRETFSTWHHGCHWYERTKDGRSEASCSNIFYRATHSFPDDDQKWVPAIFMPRWASRITLEITGVRVERLNDISERDAQLEGCDRIELGPFEIEGTLVHPMTSTYVATYKKLWESINGPGSWAANPFVWVIEFRRIPN